MAVTVEKKALSGSLAPTDLSLKNNFSCRETGKNLEEFLITTNQQDLKKRRLSLDENEEKQCFDGENPCHRRPISLPAAQNTEDLNSEPHSSLFYGVNQENLLSLKCLLPYQSRNSFSIFDKQSLQESLLNYEESGKHEDLSSLTHSLLTVVKSLNQEHREVFSSKQVSSSQNYEWNKGCVSDSSSSPRSVNNLKRCKRKGGWKFHDLSEEGEIAHKRKRPYGQNRLENEIAQLFQSRITLREVSFTNSSKSTEKMTVIEPVSISDPDLIKYNTSLRITLDKKRSVYKLQVLPFTIEEGLLSNKNQVLTAVSKMLGDKGFVLCPGIQKKLSSSSSSSSSSQTTNKTSRITDQNKLDSTNKGQLENWTSSFTENDLSSQSSKSSTAERIMISLNKKLTLANNQVKNETASEGTACLVWHIPRLVKKGKRVVWPEELKWCVNCLKNIEKS